MRHIHRTLIGRVSLVISVWLVTVTAQAVTYTLGQPQVLAPQPGLVGATSWTRPWGSYSTVFLAAPNLNSPSSLTSLVQIGPFNTANPFQRQFQAEVKVPDFSSLAGSNSGLRYRNRYYFTADEGFFVSTQGFNLSHSYDLFQPTFRFSTDGQNLYAMTGDGLFILRRGGYWDQVWGEWGQVLSCSDLYINPVTGQVTFTGRLAPSPFAEPPPDPEEALVDSTAIDQFLATGTPPPSQTTTSTEQESSYQLTPVSQNDYSLALLPTHTTLATGNGLELFRLTASPSGGDPTLEKSLDAGRTWQLAGTPIPHLRGITTTDVGLVAWGKSSDTLSSSIITLLNQPSGQWTSLAISPTFLNNPVRVIATGSALIVGDASSVLFFPLIVSG